MTILPIYQPNIPEIPDVECPECGKEYFSKDDDAPEHRCPGCKHEWNEEEEDLSLKDVLRALVCVIVGLWLVVTIIIWLCGVPVTDYCDENCVNKTLIRIIGDQYAAVKNFAVEITKRRLF